MRFVTKVILATLIAMAVVIALSLVVQAVLHGGASTSTAKTPQIPHLAVDLSVERHGVTVTIAATGDGKADTALVLQNPAGHRSQRGNGLLSNGDKAGFGLTDLKAGTYHYYVYAVPTAAKNVYSLPGSALNDDNLIDAGSFTIRR